MGSGCGTDCLRLGRNGIDRLAWLGPVRAALIHDAITFGVPTLWLTVADDRCR
jgi:hypothetical protein